MTEVGAYGFECVEQSGLHLNESEFITEVIDPASGAPADEGELVLTNLGRAGSPIFRYRSGDRVRLTGAPCPCGRSFPRLPGGILGRIDDMLIVRGVNVFPSAIEGIVRRFTAVEEFQIEVFTRSTMHEVRLLLEVDGPADLVVRQVLEAMRTNLGIRVEAQAVPAGTLPRYELKAKRLVKKA